MIQLFQIMIFTAKYKNRYYPAAMCIGGSNTLSQFNSRNCLVNEIEWTQKEAGLMCCSNSKRVVFAKRANID